MDVSMISLDIQGDTVWLANLTMELEHGEMAEWALASTPIDGDLDNRR